MTDGDAQALADSLEHVLPDIPRHDPLSHHGRGLVPDDRSAGGP